MENDIKVKCGTETKYPIIVPIGSVCHCVRRKGHNGRHLGKGYDGKYFSWRLNGVDGSILSDEVSEEQAQEIIDLDEDQEAWECVQAAE